MVAVKGATSAYAGDAEPVTRTRRGGPGRPPSPAYPHELQIVLTVILGACPLCCQPVTLDRLAAARAGT